MQSRESNPWPEKSDIVLSKFSVSKQLNKSKMLTYKNVAFGLMIGHTFVVEVYIKLRHIMMNFDIVWHFILIKQKLYKNINKKVGSQISNVSGLRVLMRNVKIM